MPDQYTRTRAQLGTPALDVLRRAHVAVFGIGGVGGQAVEVLARSGVGELSLFDSDTVALSNLNRQLVALHSTLGQYKVDAMAARIADIDPTIIVHANRMFYNAEMCFIELVDYNENMAKDKVAKKATRTRRSSKKAAATEAAPATEAPAAEAPAEEAKAE